MLVACAWSGAARADEQPGRGRPADDERQRAHLSYVRERGASACPDEAAVRRGVVAALGYDPFIEQAGAGGDTARIRCSLARRRGGDWRARISVLDGDGKVIGERKLSSEAEDCGELASAVELAIAIAIDPLFVAPPEPMVEPEPEPSPPGTTVAPGAPTGGAPAPGGGDDDEAPPLAVAALPAPGGGAAGALPDMTGVTARAQAPRWRYSAALGALTSLQAQPGVASAGTLGMGARRGRYSLHLEGRASLPSSQAVDGGTVTVRMIAAGVVPCGHIGPVATCGVIAAGGLYGEGDFDVDGEAMTPWVALGLREVFELTLSSRFAVRMTVEALHPLARTTFTVRDGAASPSVWRTPLVSGSLGLTVVRYFP